MRILINEVAMNITCVLFQVLLSTAFANGAVPSNSTHYLHLAGQVTRVNVDVLAQELNEKFLVPLNQHRSEVNISSVMQASGSGRFYLNIIVEPKTKTDLAFVDEYVAAVSNQAFEGIEVKFLNVKTIVTTATLRSGNYDGSQEDPFRQNFEVSRQFSFSTLSDWIDFTNGIGQGYSDPVNSRFIKYVQNFLSDDKSFNLVRDHVLTVSNMAAMSSLNSLFLEDDQVVDSRANQTAMIEFVYFRNCYDAKFESGMCYTAPQNTSIPKIR